MKRFLMLLLSLIMVFAFAACTDENIVTTDDSDADDKNDVSSGFTTDDSDADDKNDVSNGFTTDYIGEKVSADDAFSLDLTYYAYINITDYGTITVKLDQTQAPITVENFVNLAKSGFYDGLTFHRIMEGFMMQGGDPQGNGTGGSGKDIVGEFWANGYNNNISHVRGVISMARNGYSYDSASSQFFIMHEDYTGLDGQYAAFGYVTDGIEVVDAVCTSVTPIDNNGTIPSYAQPVIESIIITAVPYSSADQA